MKRRITPASSTPLSLIFLFIRRDSLRLPTGLRPSNGSEQSPLACHSSFARPPSAHTGLSLTGGWSLGWVEPEGGSPVARPLRFSRRQVSIKLRQHAGGNRENRRLESDFTDLCCGFCVNSTSTVSDRTLSSSVVSVIVDSLLFIFLHFKERT